MPLPGPARSVSRPFSGSGKFGTPFLRMHSEYCTASSEPAPDAALDPPDAAPPSSSSPQPAGNSAIATSGTTAHLMFIVLASFGVVVGGRGCTERAVTPGERAPLIRCY